MKQPAFKLHWQLLPFHQRRSKGLLHFDIALPVDDIVFQDRGCRTRLSDAELDKPATNSTMTRMVITFEQGPFSWEVDVQNAHGIRCRDVFEAIYKTFNEQLTPEEQRLVRNRRAVEEAFRLRCKLSPGLLEVERSHRWKRVDVLLHQTVFLGLTQPKSSGDWVLNLGTLPHTPTPVYTTESTIRTAVVRGSPPSSSQPSPPKPEKRLLTTDRFVTFNVCPSLQGLGTNTSGLCTY